MTKTLAVLAALAALPALAQNTRPEPRPVSESSVIHVKGVIEALNPDTREITVKIDGEPHTFAVKKDVKRFGELKVGDTLEADYHEAVLMEVRKPGASAPKPASGGETVRVAGLGTRPSGALVQQQVATVEVKAIDLKAQTVTVLLEGGSTTTLKARHPERLKAIKVGDQIDVTYTEALIVRVQ
jgi:hypothetical protein